MYRIIIGTCLLALLLLTGCSTAGKKDISHMEPSELVKTFYESGARKDYATARACLDDDYAIQIDGLEPYFDNLKKIRDIKVSEFTDTPLYGENFLEGQVVVEYNATYKEFFTQENGKQVRFIYVAKVGEDSPWKIIGIGTGP